MSKFAKNLFLLMQAHNLNAPALGKILGTHRTNITRYLQGKRLPGYEIFIKILEYFNVSADVLLGRSIDCDIETFNPIQPFGVTLRGALDKTHTTQYKLQKNLHFSSATTASWLAHNSLPSIEHLAQLADYLGCSVDYLLGRISPKNKKSP